MERRIKAMRLNYEMLNAMSERLGWYPSWSLAGGINMALLCWLVRFSIEEGELPIDAVPTWAWADPSTGQLRVLIYSSEFDVVPEGICAPELVFPVVEKGRLDAAVAEERAKR